MILAKKGLLITCLSAISVASFASSGYKIEIKNDTSYPVVIYGYRGAITFAANFSSPDYSGSMAIKIPAHGYKAFSWRDHSQGRWNSSLQGLLLKRAYYSLAWIKVDNRYYAEPGASKGHAIAQPTLSCNTQSTHGKSCKSKTHNGYGVLDIYYHKDTKRISCGSTGFPGDGARNCALLPSTRSCPEAM